MSDAASLHRRLSILVVTCTVIVNSAFAQNVRVYEQGQRPDDVRLGELKDLNGYFPFVVPEGKAAWEARAAELQRRVAIATGIWPMPEKTPLNPVIHGKVQRPGFTVEKVYFESMPNHFVTGLLFRPDDGKTDVKRPAVLCPHGHGGRLQDYGEKAIRQLVADGAERFLKSGRFPKLARCAELARMGCVTFIFDMLGYADSTQISFELAHRFAKQRPEFEGKKNFGLFSTQAELRLQSVMGIQTWNSIRALDFLEQLPDVDPARMGVTGGSGGGTQTILLCALDPRPVVAFPNGMVSTAMQGGCTCENCTLLRVGTGNVELAALFAPKPQAMTAARDWTVDMMTKGYPQLQQLYDMYGAKKNVYCRPLLQFPHNYNSVSRATMYVWFNDHLKLGLDDPVLEEDFEPLTPEEYTVWDDEHPRPAGGDDYERALMAYMAEQSDKQIAALLPTDAASLQSYRDVVGAAFESIIGRNVPAHDDVERFKVSKEPMNGYILFKDKIRLTTHKEELPVISLFPTGTKWNGDVVIWVDGDGKQGMFDASGQVQNRVLKLVDNGTSVVTADLFQQGDFLPGGQKMTQQRVVNNPREAAAYTFAYNDTLFVRRVHDLLTLLAWIRDDDHQPQHVHMVGVNGAGPLVAAARVIARGQIDAAAVDTGGFRFADLTSYRHPQFLPGAVKYGDLPALLALSAPHPLWIAGEGDQIPEIVNRTYVAGGYPDAVQSYSQLDAPDQAVEWLLTR